MARRRQSDDLEGLIVPVAALLFFLGAAVLAILKTLLAIVAAAAIAALAAFGVYHLARRWWRDRTKVEDYLPEIDWRLPLLPVFDTTWLSLPHPGFPKVADVPAPPIIGTSGAWKDVVAGLDQVPPLRGASGPRDLLKRVAACEAAAPGTLRLALARAENLARKRQAGLQAEVLICQEAGLALEARVRPKLVLLRDTIEALAAGGVLERARARRLVPHLADFESQFQDRIEAHRIRATRYEKAVREFLDPALREGVLRERLEQELVAMRAIPSSREFAGAVAEMEVIDELRSLQAGSLVINDLKMESGRYIHFGGKALLSAQIDTLVITGNGVFVIEVKNWSRDFAEHGDGFDPYEQASRASYLVFDRLRSAGMHVPVRTVIATKGSLPEKGDQKVAVVAIGRIRRYIERDRPGLLDVNEIRMALGI